MLCSARDRKEAALSLHMVCGWYDWRLVVCVIVDPPPACTVYGPVKSRDAEWGPLRGWMYLMLMCGNGPRLASRPFVPCPPCPCPCPPCSLSRYLSFVILVFVHPPSFVL